MKRIIVRDHQGFKLPHNTKGCGSSSGSLWFASILFGFVICETSVEKNKEETKDCNYKLFCRY